jgi:hypothetical protein
VQFGKFLADRFRCGEPSRCWRSTQQSAREQDANDCFGGGFQLAGWPAEKQFRAHQGANAAHRPCHARGIEAAVVAQQAGDQRRQGENMQYVVAKIGEQGRLLVTHADQIAQWIGETLDDCESLGVGHHLLRVERAGNRRRRIRCFAKQCLVVHDHPLQCVFIGGVLGGGEAARVRSGSPD